MMKTVKVLFVAAVAALAGCTCFRQDGEMSVRESGCAEIAWTRSVCVEPDRYIGWPTVCRLK